MQLSELDVVDSCWGVHHGVLGFAGLREGVDFADVVFVFEDHHESVHTYGESSVRRSSVLEGFVHGSEFFFDFLSGSAYFFECFDEGFYVMVSDGSRKDLVSVAGEIILHRFYFEKVFFFECFNSSFWQREWVVTEIYFSSNFIYFKHWEIFYPTESQDIFIFESEEFREMDAEFAHV